MRHDRRGQGARDWYRGGRCLGAPRDRDRRHDHQRESDQRDAIVLADQNQRGGGEQVGTQRAG